MKGKKTPKMVEVIRLRRLVGELRGCIKRAPCPDGFKCDETGRCKACTPGCWKHDGVVL